MSKSPCDDITGERFGRYSLRRLSNYMSECVAAWGERRFAKIAARRALACFEEVHAERPDLTGESLYEAFLCRRSALEASAARMILRHAESSFTMWPTERDLIFRDVVQYLVLSEYLETYPKRVGAATNVIKIIAKVIPKQL